MDITLLATVLTYLSGPAAGIAAYYLIDRVPKLKALSAEYKRYASLALAAILAMGAFIASVGLSYQVRPISPQGWLEALFAVAGVAIGLSQSIHGYKKLRR